MERTSLKLVVIGAGVVGKATGVGLLKLGHSVVFYDIDRRKQNQLRDEGYAVTTNLVEAIAASDASFICVPTPLKNGTLDTRFVLNVARQVGMAFGKSKSYRVVVIRSTMVPKTARLKVIPVIENFSGRSAGDDFGVCVNPEFSVENRIVQQFLNPDRIVIGGLDDRSARVVRSIFARARAPIIQMSLEEAEFVKCAANSFLSCKISFFNEMWLVANKLKLNNERVAKAVAMDKRIGFYGTRGGWAFGGSCLVKDGTAFRNYVRQTVGTSDILTATFRINDKIRRLKSDHTRR